MWGKQPRPAQTMSRQEREMKFSDQGWKLAQKQHGGHDTIPTSLYPDYHRDHATVEDGNRGLILKERQKDSITLKESPKWQSSTSSSTWKDSSWKESGTWLNNSATPGTSSTSWHQDSWQSSGWKTYKDNHYQNDFAKTPWYSEENQWKRRKW